MAEKRLQFLAINLSKQEKEVSIEVDEMSLEPKMKQWDRIFGQVNSGGILVIQDGKPILANRLLAFHMTGLSTSHDWTFGIQMYCGILFCPTTNS